MAWLKRKSCAPTRVVYRTRATRAIASGLFMVAVAGSFLVVRAGAGDGVSSVSGAGATFPYPLYAKWAAQYARRTHVNVNYQSIGSGGGIKQVSARTVEFGASDAPLHPAELKDKGLVQWPMVVGGVVPVVNLEQVAAGQLKLGPDVLADMFLGKIAHWDDARIRQLNPGLQLPHAQVHIVHRSDASGTTWIFTHYLSNVSPDWTKRVGSGTAVQWPTGVGGKGNEGVASYVQRIAGALGYVEYAYVLQNHMNHVALRNKAGRFVEPEAKTFQAAATNADWKNALGFYLVLTDQPGDGSWPIAGATFILMHAQQPDPAKAVATLKFFDWAYTNGDEMAAALDYVSIPDTVVDLVRRAWHEQLRGPNGQVLWPASTGTQAAKTSSRGEKNQASGGTKN